MASLKNSTERQSIRLETSQARARLSSRLSFIYEYVKRKYHELKFSQIPGDIFSEMRESTDAKIGVILPNSVEKFTAIYDSLTSENSESLANAVHSCRRILNDLADAVFPATKEIRKTESGHSIKLEESNYINRIMAFVGDSSSSETFTRVFGTHINFLGDRLDSIYNTANKGTHTTVGKIEAHRYVIYTYMLLADILSLVDVDNFKN